MCGIFACPPNFSTCTNGSVCTTNIQTDANNCGACSNTCSPKLHSQAACVQGACNIVCDDGWIDCDGNISNGCEAEIDKCYLVPGNIVTFNSEVGVFRDMPGVLNYDGRIDTFTTFKSPYNAAVNGALKRLKKRNEKVEQEIVPDTSTVGIKTYNE